MLPAVVQNMARRCDGNNHTHLGRRRDWTGVAQKRHITPDCAGNTARQATVTPTFLFGLITLTPGTP